MNQIDIFERILEKFSGEIKHYGVLRRSGRYPWGSGENAYQRNNGFLAAVEDLKKQGFSEAEIAKSLLGPRATSSDIRALKAIAKTQNREADIAMAVRLKDKGMSNVAIGERMGINESSVRSLLDPTLRERNDILKTVADNLKNQVGEDGYLDVGAGVEIHMGIAESKKKVALAMLKEEGYNTFYVPVRQLGTGNETTVMVLAPPGKTFKDVMQNQDNIKSIDSYSENGGRDFIKVQPPKHVDAKRVSVRYAEEGGADKDGVIELRRGVDDLSLGAANYAQVRIGVGGTHYLKGMAMYADDLPAGVDIRFNTNKSNTGNKLDAMKGIKKNKETGEADEVLPFGSIVRQKHYIDKNGKTQLSPLNIVGSKETSGEEGGWSLWSKTLSSQMLSKQSPALAQRQLDIAFNKKKEEYDEIMALQNPAVRKKLLEEFADGADSAAKHLKAAGLPRTANHVILPINSLKDNEIYAPNYREGESVVLIRHPHGGRFEIPELTVTHRNKEANRVMKNAKDAVGINSKVAARLSGADFDGDTVLVIPNNNKLVKTSQPLAGLKNFDPQAQYKMSDGRSNGMTPKGKQKQMGDISNLITDMTIKGASSSEIARAVRHSMVVIDAEKHNLNYKQSFLDNGITELKTKYQGGPKAGASTLISKAKSTEYVDQRKPRSAADGGPVDPKTGRKVYTPTNEEYTVTKVNKRTGAVSEKVIRKQTKSTKMDEAADAHSLSSGTIMEKVYANHANGMKGLANSARKAAISTKPRSYEPTAKKTYAAEVAELNRKLRVAKSNAPLERKAQLLANTLVKTKTQSNPQLDNDELKKIKSMALVEARLRVGAKKAVITFTPREWEAIQAGAISNNMLTAMLNNADMDQVRQLATPRQGTVMSDAKIRRAKNLLNNGYSQAEVADLLGVPTSTLHDSIQ